VTKEQACTKRFYTVKPTELPLSCPTKEMLVWNAHPRVYLPIEESGHVTCPYCNAEFVLENVE
jgi:uncharacterized Zn-finger protein